MRRVTLEILAAGRRDRLRANGTLKLDLTTKEIERSTETAMRLAGAELPRRYDRNAAVR